MSQIRTHQGNATSIPITLKQNGSPITNLATATGIQFVLQSIDGGAFAVDTSTTSGEPPSGGGITINSPATGSITVALDSTQMAIAAGTYTVAVEVTWTASNKIEWVSRGSVIVEAEVIT